MRRATTLRYMGAAFAALVTTISFALPASAAPASGQTQHRGAAGDFAAEADLLGPQWSKSGDVLIDGYGDDRGYHIFTAKEDEGFAPRALATLVPGDHTSEGYTGYACLTSSSRYVVAVAAPAKLANSPSARESGATAYVIDVPSGAITEIATHVALVYHSPGCGVSDRAVVLRQLGEDGAASQLLTIDAARKTVHVSLRIDHQLSSAIPTAAGITALAGPHVVGMTAAGRSFTVGSPLPGRPYDLRVAGSGIAYLDAEGGTAVAYYQQSAIARRVREGSGPLNQVALEPGSPRPTIVNARTGPAAPGVMTVIHSSNVLTVASASQEGDAITGVPLGARSPATRELVARSSGQTSAIAFLTPAPAGPVATAALATPLSPAVNTSTPKCAVPRNKTTNQVPQPGRKQVEWAIDEATRGSLTNSRPSNYLNTGLAAYAPSSDFPATSLSGGGTLPPNVYAATAAQESNFDQASFHALPGLAGNPLVADYYGAAGGTSSINFDNSDCGYGIGQITTGMQASDTTPYSANSKTKIALDYQENIAAGLQVLGGKWNELAGYGVTANGGSAAYLENWYLAAWDYNTGYHSTADSAGMYGLGWTNNPINPNYPPNRAGFLRTSYADAATPANWPYQEKVLGWMEHPQLDYKGDPEYATPTWGANQPSYGQSTIGLNLPSYSLFCNASNDCDPNYAPSGVPGNSVDYCKLSSRDCWWHEPVTWAACPSRCATATYSYSGSATDPGVTNPHPPDCQSTLPPGSHIVDDEPVDLNVVGCGTSNWSSTGSFSISSLQTGSTYPVAVIDTHQLGAGFGGHLYFTHNVSSSDSAHIVTGTWTASLPTHLYHVLAHVPSTGGSTLAATYKITASDGSVSSYPVNQYTSKDEWVGVGYANLGSNAKVTLNNITGDKQIGSHDVAFDAVAFVPYTGTLVKHTFDAVSLFDWKTNLDTHTPVNDFNSQPLQSEKDAYNWGIEYTQGGPDWRTNNTQDGILQHAKCASASTSTAQCVQSDVLSAAQAWSTQVQDAGPNQRDANGVSAADWLGFATTHSVPTRITASTFASDGSYKVKTHIDVSWVKDSSGNVVPGTEQNVYTERTGSTHIAPFAYAFMNAVAKDYGIPAPNLSYEETNANTFSGDTTPVNPNAAGLAPGEAYGSGTDAASIDATKKCVTAHSVGGGTIGYRPMAGDLAVTNAVKAWAANLTSKQSSGQVKMPAVIPQVATQIYDVFFRQAGLDNLTGSLFLHAPPIWENVSMEVCGNGTVASTSEYGDKDDNPKGVLVEQSYMPNLYLYLDNNEITQTGAPGTGPVQVGDFNDFSHDPVSAPSGNAFGLCADTSRGNGGNPWGALAIDNTSSHYSDGFFCDAIDPTPPEMTVTGEFFADNPPA